jgi:hypothetical protein
MGMKIKFNQDYTVKAVDGETYKKDETHEFESDASARHFISRGVAEEVEPEKQRKRTLVSTPMEELEGEGGEGEHPQPQPQRQATAPGAATAQAPREPPTRQQDERTGAVKGAPKPDAFGSKDIKGGK